MIWVESKNVQDSFTSPDKSIQLTVVGDEVLLVYPLHGEAGAYKTAFFADIETAKEFARSLFRDC